MEGLFADSKTFADATPRSSPPVILGQYRETAPASREALLQFVTGQFDIPGAVSTAPAPGGETVEAHIAALWPVLIRQAPHPPAYSSLLAVPKPYVVPGGRFREFYYWDSYFTLLGLILDGHADAARDQVDDFSYLLDRYGHIPNGARTYYLSRSQPPFYYLMVGLVSPGATASHLRHLQAEYAFWMAGAQTLRAGEAHARVVRMPDGSILNRYWDDRNTPRDESYKEDVMLARSSPRPAEDLYRDLRAAAESGWDFSSRWFADGRSLATIRTTSIVPADLNSLLYGLEQAISQACQEIHERACEDDFAAKATRRAAGMRHYLWDPQLGFFSDYDWREHSRTGRLSVATLYPLFVGLAGPEEAGAIATVARAQLLAPGGLVTTTVATGQQWDAPNGWPPLQWVAIRGLERYGHRELAHQIASRWIGTVRRVYAENGRLLEKYDVQTVRPGGGGEYPLQDGFGWTNGVTRALLEDYPDLKSR